MPLLVLQSLGPAELLIILAILVILFGAGRIAGLGKGMGRAIRDFRREVREGEADSGTERAKASTRAEGEEPYRGS